MSNKKDLVKYGNSAGFNMGVVVFFIIIIYVLFNIFFYFTKPHVAEYQVQQGTIASNNIYQGIIVRDETVEYASQSGYINYYVKNASKVSVNDVIYSIDTTGEISNAIIAAGSADSLSKESLSEISQSLDSFIKDYNENHFSDSYTFYNNLNTTIAQSINTNTLSALTDKVNLAEANNTFFKYKSSQDGIIIYEIDGFENYTIEDITSAKINYNGYKSDHLFENTEVSSTDPVYKRINSEDWNIIIPISENLAKELNNNSSVKIRFCKDDFTTNASYGIIKNSDEDYYLNISLKKAMIRYVNDRFIDVELVMTEKSGLKIPQSAITSKEFFTVPKEYFSLGGDSSTPGLMIKHTVDGVDTVKTLYPTLYYETEEYYYVDNEELSDGDKILLPDSNSTYTIGTDKGSLIGVYNINKGYAVFKQINIIYENEEYAIVETKTSYGISLYDHIALDAGEIKENQLTSK